MERVTRVVVMKKIVLGGCGFPDVASFLGMHFWLSHFKIFSSGGNAACLMRYLAGWSLVRWGWCEKDLSRPMALVAPYFYGRLEQFFKDYDLKKLGVGAVGKAQLVKWLNKDEVVANIRGLGPKLTEKCWSNFLCKGTSNRQKEVMWMAFQECLMKKSFLKARDLCRTDVCPRVGCNEFETAEHALFGCVFVKRVRKLLAPFVSRILGVVEDSVYTWFFGLVRGDKDKKRRVWIFMAIFKEVMWDVRCWEVRGKRVVVEEDCVNLCMAKLYLVLLVDRKWMGVEEANVFWRWEEWRGGGR